MRKQLLEGELEEIDAASSSLVEVRLLGEYDLVMFDKVDLEPVKEQLRSDLSLQGFRMVEKRSPLGAYAETNALWAGKNIPFSVLQSVIELLTEHGIRIKRLCYQYNLRSGNPYEIQVGGSALHERTPARSDDEIQRMLSATTEAEFEAACDCNCN